ncbi:MAG: L,D-transpeptidase [Alphaproteobacteria bacterium]
MAGALARRLAALVLAAGVWAAPQAVPAAMAEPAAGPAAGTAAPPALRAAPAMPESDRGSAPLPRIWSVPSDAFRHLPLQRIHRLVRPELFDYFDLFLYVNKAARGASAQHMYIYERLPNGKFVLRHRWLTSTGRELQERYFTTTPTGIYKLDADRFHEYWESRAWDGVPMPWTMFVDFAYDSGRMSGIAIHGTNSLSRLGSRASGGCIRLAMKNARLLFNVIQSYFAGAVPEFAWDDLRGHTSRTGELRRDEDGDLVMENGYRVLLIVDNVNGIPRHAGHAQGGPPRTP